MPRIGLTPPDPFIFDNSFDASFGRVPYLQTSGLTIRSQAINPAQNTLALLGAGQSNYTSNEPTLYLPTNSAAIDTFNQYDGACYSINGPLVGISYSPTQGPGNMLVKIADKLVSAGKYDRVIIVPVAVGSSGVADWATGSLVDRIPCTMRRLASRGFIPGTPGLTFAITWGQGETDCQNGTTQAAYTTALNSVIATSFASGFVGKFFVNIQTLDVGNVSAAVQAAQAAVVNNTTVFAGGNLDTLTGTTNRQADLTHFNDVGGAAAATLIAAKF
jgi:hypothetical protein